MGMNLVVLDEMFDGIKKSYDIFSGLGMYLEFLCFYLFGCLEKWFDFDIYIIWGYSCWDGFGNFIEENVDY